MSPNEKAAFIVAQVQMMIAERDVMIAENVERAQQGFAPAHGPDEWEKMRQRWEPIFGYNSLLIFFRENI